MSEDAPRKRSRFDQTEPAPKVSRFDRRSRSPSGQKSESRRSRSPVEKKPATPNAAEQKAAATAAAAAAAKINAQIQQKKASGEYNPATIKPITPSSVKSPSGPKNDIYQQDGDYIKDIEVNDLRNRYTLTKGSTQKMIKDETGADVTTRGEYYPDPKLATAAKPPLYLHVTSTNREGLEKAVEKINEMIKQDLPNLVDERRFRRVERREEVERDEYGRRKWPEAKIPIDLEPIPGFNLRAQVVGQQGSYVKHIQNETSCRVQIKGRGSGFHERDTNEESDETMYLHVSAPHPDQVQRGKDMCEDLLGNVRERYEEHKARGPRGPPRYRRDDDQDGYGGRHRDSQQGYDPYNPNLMSPGAGGAPAANHYDPQQSQQQQAQLSPEDQMKAMQQWSEYYAQYPEADPYKDQGGYGAMMQQYYAYYYSQQGQPAADPQQAQQQQYNYYQQGYNAGSPTPGANAYGQPPPPGGNDPPPPPPPDDVPPPPPPPSGPPGTGGYNSVPPPPGL